MKKILFHDNYKRDFPVYLVPGLDQHESQKDYVSLVQHEIDLYEEGEESDIVNSSQYQYCKAYLEQYTS